MTQRRDVPGKIQKGRATSQSTRATVHSTLPENAPPPGSTVPPSLDEPTDRSGLILGLALLLVAAGAASWFVLRPATDSPASMSAAVSESMSEAAIPTLPVSSIIENPSAWLGNEVEGETEVATVPVQGGFWITESNDRLFVALEPSVRAEPQPETPNQEGAQESEVEVAAQPGLDLSVGARVRLDGAMVNNFKGLAQPSLFDAGVRSILEGQEVFLVVSIDELESLESLASSS